LSHFRRTFIAATLLGLSAGFAVQRCTRTLPPPVRGAREPAETLPELARLADGLSLVGRVRLPDGSPAVGAAVVAVDGSGAHGARTDESGAFRLLGLEPGEPRIDLIHPGFAPQSRRVAVPSEQVLDWTLERAFPALEPLPELRRSPLFGRVEPQPLGGAQHYGVWIRPVEAPHLAGLAGRVDRRVRVDAEGRFAIDDLAHGDYEAVLLPPWAAEGHWPQLVTVLLEHDGQLGAGGAAGELRLPGTAAELFGTLRDERGEPLAGALVLLSVADDADRLWPPQSTALDGSFRFGDLPGGSYRVEVVAGNARVEQLLRVPSLRSVPVDFGPLHVGP
jgi:hypothetical protein